MSNFFLECFWHVAVLAPTSISLYADSNLPLPFSQILFISCVELAILRFSIPEKVYFAITSPLLLFGVARCFILFSRQINIFDLYVQINTFSALEIKSELLHNSLAILIATAITALLCAICIVYTKTAQRTRLRTLQSILLLVAFFKLVPLNTLAVCWPSDFIFASTGFAFGDHFLYWHMFPNHSSQSTRRAVLAWNTKNTGTYHGEKQTIILVIGETVRSDFLNECNGPQKTRTVTTNALVACDTTAGADSTANSVPLLISRDLPGHPSRIPNDSTFESALGEVDFESYWIGSQFASVARPDAKHRAYDFDEDRDFQLLPYFSQALETHFQRKVIVLHTYGAHAPYATRCEDLDYHYSSINLQNSILEYSNAVDASILFINKVIDIANTSRGEVFLVFAPDHGENLYDDDRRLYAYRYTQLLTHSLKPA